MFYAGPDRTVLDWTVMVYWTVFFLLITTSRYLHLIELWLIINNMMEHKSTGFIKHIHLAKANRNGLKKDAELGRGPSASSPHSPNKIFVAVRFVIGFVIEFHNSTASWLSSSLVFQGTSKHSISLQQIVPMCQSRKLIGHTNSLKL